MAIWERTHFSWEGFTNALKRLATANGRATADWLRSLTPEESIEIFESLSEGIPEIPFETSHPPPVPLFRIWRD